MKGVQFKTLCLLVIISLTIASQEDNESENAETRSGGLQNKNCNNQRSCDNIQCPRTEVCSLEQVFCIRAPCPPQPRCVSYDKLRERLCEEAGCTSGSECLLQQKTGPRGNWFAVCKDQECDLECDPGEKCVVLNYPPWARCVPDPDVDPCENVPCSAGFQCKVVSSSKNPRPTPRCVPIPNYDPCESHVCPEGKKCIAVRRRPCGYTYDSLCPRVAKCVPIHNTSTGPCSLVDCRPGTYCVEVPCPTCLCRSRSGCRMAKCVPNRCKTHTCRTVRCHPGYHCVLANNPDCPIFDRNCCPKISKCVRN